ncbi:hypothetical protein PBI_SPORTO_76 [Arthrobacter phage Sporto]|nr:hypothetical protein PBI_SPORTO_76 [Arthrobacter phage Sporto]
MSDNVEWRTIPGFPKYEMTEEGDVRNRDSKYLLKEIENKNTGAFSYCLHIGWGNVTTHRNFWGLVYLTFPELLEDWRDIPGVEGYMFNREGAVMGKRNWQPLQKPERSHYVLRKGGKRVRWHMGLLSAEELDAIWNGTKEKEAA